MEAGDEAWALFGEEGPQGDTDIRVAEVIKEIASRKELAQNEAEDEARYDATWKSLLQIPDAITLDRNCGDFDIACKRQRHFNLWTPTLAPDARDADRTLAEALKTYSPTGSENHDMIARSCASLLSSSLIFSVKLNLFCEDIIRLSVSRDSFIACLAELCLLSSLASRRLAIAQGTQSHEASFAMLSFVVAFMLSHRDLCVTSLNEHFGSIASASRFLAECLKSELHLSSTFLRQASRHAAMFSHVRDSMKKERFVVIDDFLQDGGELCETLRNGLLTFDAQGFMRQGEFGSGLKSKRGDSIIWFRHDGHVEDVTSCAMPHDACKVLLSRICMLVGILDWRLDAMDFMGAIYPPSNGLGFVKHIDNPVGDGRHFTAVYYLNKGWRAEYGATLRAWPLDAEDAVEVTPEADRLVLFAADSIYHEVTPNVHEERASHSMRCSITLWFYLKSEVENWKERQTQLGTRAMT